MPAKVGIKSCRFAREYVLFVHAYRCTTQLELCLYDQTQIIANAACRVGSQSAITYVARYSKLLISLPFIGSILVLHRCTKYDFKYY